MIKGSQDRGAVEQAAGLFGLQVEWSAPPEHIDVFPDHWAPLLVAQAMATQWQASASGALVGWRYESLPVVMDMLELKVDAKPDLFTDLRTLETEMLTLMRAKNG